MKYKEFRKWCNDRCFDACWGMNEAIICTGVIEDMRKYPFWKREKVWRDIYRDEILSAIVEPTNELIKRYKGE